MPRVVDHDVRRAELAEAVWRIITEKGIENVTVSEIAKESGWSTGVLAHYFTNKDSLLLFAFRLGADRAGERQRRHLRNPSPAVALRGLLLETFPLDSERRVEAEVWTSFIGRAKSDAALADEFLRRYQEWRRVITGLLEAGIESGEFGPTLDTAAVTDALMALVDGLNIQAILEPKRFPRARQLHVLDCYLMTLSGTP